MRIPERRNYYKRDEYPRRPPTFKNQRSFNQCEGNYRRVDHEPKWTASQRKSLTPRYQNLFLGHLDIRKLIVESMKGTTMQET